MFSLAVEILLNNLFYIFKVLQDTELNNNIIKFRHIPLIQKIQLVSGWVTANKYTIV